MITTIEEMHYDFQVKIDKVASLSKANFHPAEIDWLLNEAQVVRIKRRYKNVNNNTRTGFEVDQKRIDELSALVIKYPEQPSIIPTIHDDGTLEVELSTLVYPYMFFVSGQIEKLPVTCEKWISLKYIQHDDINDALVDPFNNAGSEFIPFNYGKSSNSQGSSIYIYPGNQNVLNVKITYIKQPARLNIGGYAYIDGITYPQQDPELPFAEEIVDVAVEIASGIIEHPEYTALRKTKAFTDE